VCLPFSKAGHTAPGGPRSDCRARAKRGVWGEWMGADSLLPIWVPIVETGSDQLLARRRRDQIQLTERAKAAGQKVLRDDDQDLAPAATSGDR
jgi:hypothetical protein